MCRYRDAADVAEMIETYPQYFLTPDFKLVPFMIFEKDNSHGVQDLSCRFSFTVLALLYDLDYLCIGSQEAGYSMLHTVESMNGALSRRLNGAPFTLDLPAPDAASPSELRAAEKLVLKEICRRANGATYSTGGGNINVVESRSTLLRSGFEFRATELAAYVEAAKAGRGGAFLANTLKSMDGYAGDYAQLLARAWRVLHAPGVTQCTKTSAHAFHFYKNVLNPDCLPRRGPACFFEFLDLFGGTLPQPKRSVLRPFVDAKTDPGHYMDMAERCSSTGRGATGVDEFYPRTLLDDKLEDAALSLIDAFLEGDSTLPATMRDSLCKEMCVDEKTLYAELTERIAKAEYTSTDPTTGTSPHGTPPHMSPLGTAHCHWQVLAQVQVPRGRAEARRHRLHRRRHRRLCACRLQARQACQRTGIVAACGRAQGDCEEAQDQARQGGEACDAPRRHPCVLACAARRAQGRALLAGGCSTCKAAAAGDAPSSRRSSSAGERSRRRSCGGGCSGPGAQPGGGCRRRAAAGGARRR
jgi:hypothetical protein